MLGVPKAPTLKTDEPEEDLAPTKYMLPPVHAARADVDVAPA
jgi:hypothetical protein